MISPLIDSWLSLFGESVRRSGDTGNQWTALCPAHDDLKHSLAIGVGKDGRVLLKCYANCTTEQICRAVGKEMADLFPAQQDDEPLTVERLALDKRLPAAFLRDQCGLRDDGRRGVGMPYCDEQHKRLFLRYRSALRAKDGTWQPKGVSLKVYGLWRLAEARQQGTTLLLVEGESDCWTLWYHGFAALGIPGASAIRTLLDSMLVGFTRVYLWQEPGEAGQKFVSKLAKRLQEADWKGEVRVVSGNGAKDPNELHQRNPDGFKEAFARLLEGATSAEKVAASEGKSAGPFVPGIVSSAPDSAAINCTPPGLYGLTDWGNAQRLAVQHGKDIRYCYPWNKWLAWTGRCWLLDALNVAVQRGKNTVVSIYLEATRGESAEIRRAISEHAVASESCRAIYSMVKLAQTEPSLEIVPARLDANPWLLNCPNGTVDLSSGEVRTHRREDFITKVCTTNYVKDANCPLWKRFLHDIFAGNAEMIGYVQRLLGYCITGDVSTHILPVFWGCGGNGKGTLLNTMLHVIGGDYSGAAAAELLTARRQDRHPTEVADLLGKRLVVCQETDDGCRLNEPLVKWLTGGDRLQARRMREDPWQFDPTHKIILSTNYRPTVRGTDRGIWRRLRLVPFTVTFSGADEDRGLPERLKAEAPGILAWCIEGCLSWQRDGEQVPSTVLVATTEYRQEEDAVRRYINECCQVGDDHEIRASALYAGFIDWLDKAGEQHRRLSQTKFGIRIVEMGFERFTSNGTHYRGLTLTVNLDNGRVNPSVPVGTHTHTTCSGNSNGRVNPSVGRADGPLDLSQFDT